MKSNNIIITAAVIVILAVIAYMVYDFLGTNNKPEENVYKYTLDDLNKVDPSLVNYTETQQFKPEIEKIKAVAIDKNDNIYVAGKDKITIYDESGKILKDIVTDAEASSIYVDENNDIFLGAKDHVEVWGIDGTLKNSWGIINDRVIITSIAVADSSVFVADAGNKIVYRFDVDGTLLNEIGRKDSTKGIQGFIIPSPYFDVAIGRDNELWVVNSGRHQLESYDVDGNLISSWVKRSMTIDGFSGCCNPSHIAILADGSFVTSEKGLVRVKILNPTGKLKSVVAGPDQFDEETRGLDLAVDSENRIIVLDPKKRLIRIFEKNDR